ncbi:MAG: hypothetical protein IIZ93_00565 [Acidaminococcaceae bacterium]|nr:hypothetical protein [Acidaminococcaceae bacterium]
MKLFKSLLGRVLTAQTETEWNTLCADIDFAYQHEKIKADENELLYRFINRLHK